jgi:hypothetical protein
MKISRPTEKLKSILKNASFSFVTSSVGLQASCQGHRCTKLVRAVIEKCDQNDCLYRLSAVSGHTLGKMPKIGHLYIVLSNEEEKENFLWASHTTDFAIEKLSMLGCEV